MPNALPDTFHSDAKLQTLENVADASRAWRTLQPRQRLAFERLGKIWSPKGRPSSPGIRVFQSLSLARMQVSLGILTDPPQLPDAVQSLPALSLTAPRDGAALQLLLAVGGPFPHRCILSATRPVSAGVMRFRPSDFRQIDARLSLEPGLLDITAAYARVHGCAPDAGMQVALTLCPVSDNGFRGSPRLLTAVAG